jgi:hypothetical protein
VKTLKAILILFLMTLGFNAVADRIDRSSFVPRRISVMPSPVPNSVHWRGPINFPGPQPTPNFVIAPGPIHRLPSPTPGPQPIPRPTPNFVRGPGGEI